LLQFGLSGRVPMAAVDNWAPWAGIVALTPFFSGLFTAQDK